MSLHLFSFSFSWFSFFLFNKERKSKLFISFGFCRFAWGGGRVFVSCAFLSLRFFVFLTSALAEHVNETTAVIKKNATSRFVQRLLQR